MQPRSSRDTRGRFALGRPGLRRFDDQADGFDVRVGRQGRQAQDSAVVFGGQIEPGRLH